MKRYCYASIADNSLHELNGLLRHGWVPVREVFRESEGEATGNLLILLEREDELPVLSGETLAGGIRLDDISQNEIFSGCTGQEIREIIAACDSLCFEQESELIGIEDEQIALFILLSGEVEVHLPNIEQISTDETFITKLGAGEVLGEVSFFAELPHGGVVTANSAVQALRLSRESYDQLLQAQSSAAHKLGLNVARILARRLHETDHWMWKLLRAEKNARIARSWRQFREDVRLPFDKPGGLFRAAPNFG